MKNKCLIIMAGNDNDNYNDNNCTDDRHHHYKYRHCNNSPSSAIRCRSTFYIHCVSEFTAKLVLEVFGGGGAIWVRIMYSVLWMNVVSVPVRAFLLFAVRCHYYSLLLWLSSFVVVVVVVVLCYVMLYRDLVKRVGCGPVTTDVGGNCVPYRWPFCSFSAGCDN